jgi:alcohol dehydrogenase (cytochrome c)
VTWAKGIDRDGRPVVIPGTDPTPEGNNVCPGVTGATNYMSPSYSPQTGLLYVTAREQCDTYYSSPQAHREGGLFFGSTNFAIPGEEAWGALRALDARTGELRWEFRYVSPPMSGTLATAGGLVFAGNAEGHLIAFDARTGKDLWHVQTGASIDAAPISYALDDRQYIAIPAGGGLFVFALPERVATRSAAGRN